MHLDGLAKVAAAAALCALATAGAVRADAPELIVIGATVQEVSPMRALTLPTLPPAALADDAVFVARLAAGGVAQPGATGAGALYLSLDASSLPGDSTRLRIGAEALSAPEIAARLDALLGAAGTGERGFALIKLDGAPAETLPALRPRLESLGFAAVALVGNAPAACSGVLPDLLAGMADRAPFGDANGTTTVAEAMAYVARPGACGTGNVVLLPGAGRPETPAVRGTPAVLPSEAEDRFLRERFEARTLVSVGDAARIDAFLSDCRFCPDTAELTARLDRLRQTEARRAREAALWQSVRAEPDPASIGAYLDACTVCEARAEAEALLDRLAAAEATRAAEAAALEEALASGDPVRLQAHLDSCEVCDGKDRIAVALVEAHRRHALIAPCLEAAGLPQHGGPRLLSAIDPEAARAVCAPAAEVYPDDPMIVTVLGRIAQAEGRHEAALDAFTDGMAAGLPAAYGLTAFTRYAPPPGRAPDIEAAEALARHGAEKGDWLSQEILAVLYARDGYPGRTPADAFRIALRIAEEGNALGQFFVGYFYLTGIGVAPSDEAAARWLSRAVDRGAGNARVVLAGMLEQGRGTGATPKRAAELYWAAFEDGETEAVQSLTIGLTERNADVIRYVQKKLAEAEVYFGAIDGIAGPRTRAAMDRYSARMGAPG